METQINKNITGPFDHLACCGNATRLAPKLITNSAVVFLIQLPQGDLSLTHTPLRGMYTLKNIKLFHTMFIIFFSSRSRHSGSFHVTGVQGCALPF